MIDWQNIIWILIGAVLYAIGYKITEIIIDEIKEKKIRVRKKEKIDLSGTWYAVWQTTVEGKENINSEVLQIKQKGDKIIMENIEKKALKINLEDICGKGNVKFMIMNTFSGITYQKSQMSSLKE